MGADRREPACHQDSAALSPTFLSASVPQKLHEAGVDVTETGKKGAGLQEENKTLKEEVKTMKEDLDSTKKGEQQTGCLCLKPANLFCSPPS